MNVELRHAQPERLYRLGLLRLSGRLNLKGTSRQGELGALGAIGNESVVADSHEPGWQDVHQKTADELVGFEAHHLAAIAVGIVLVAEAHVFSKFGTN